LDEDDSQEDDLYKNIGTGNDERELTSKTGCHCTISYHGQ